MLQQLKVFVLTVVLLVACAIPLLVYPKLNSLLAPYTPLPRSGLQHHHQIPHLKDVTLVAHKIASSTSQYGGFVLATSYYDEMTSATRRLFKLHGWAAKFNISVVEPFIIRSNSLGLNEQALYYFRRGKGRSRIFARFSNVLDLDDWNSFIKSKYSNARMVLWEDFLNHAPRSVIYIVVRAHKGIDGKRPSAKLQFENCPDKISTLKYLSIYNFTVLNAWCVNMEIGTIRVSMDMFTSSFLQDHSMNNVTIVFSRWRGNTFYPTNTASLATYKVPGLSHSEMARVVSYSPGIMKSVETYVKNYIGSQNYVAVMLRTQRALLQKNDSRSTMENITICTRRIIAKWNEMKQRKNITATFLAMDVGDFGSKHNSIVFLRQHGRYIPINKFVSTLLGNATTIEMWEHSFVDVSMALTSVIIAMVQKVLAAQSTCLILAGGGSFQVSTEELYKTNHQHGKRLCIKKIQNCAAKSS